MTKINIKVLMSMTGVTQRLKVRIEFVGYENYEKTKCLRCGFYQILSLLRLCVFSLAKTLSFPHIYVFTQIPKKIQNLIT
jgi:hypothetical protein